MKFSIHRALVLTVLEVAIVPCFPAQQQTAIEPTQVTPAVPAAVSPKIPESPSQTLAQESSQSAPPSTTRSSDGSKLIKDSNGSYTISSTTRLVVLDMVVTDVKGNIVKDLKRENFHVEDADEPPTILSFEEAGSHTPDPSLTINSTHRRRVICALLAQEISWDATRKAGHAHNADRS
jgi:hypothetical protein